MNPSPPMGQGHRATSGLSTPPHNGGFTGSTTTLGTNRLACHAISHNRHTGARPNNTHSHHWAVLGTKVATQCKDHCIWYLAFKPDSPGKMSSSDRGSSATPVTKLAYPSSEGCKSGQNGADNQRGTTNVPTALHTCAWPITLGISVMGGHHQLFSPPQFTVNASTASEPGFQHLLLNQGVCQL